MMRMMMVMVLSLALPVLAHAVWRLATRKPGQPVVDVTPGWPWARLVLAGVVVMALALLGLRVVELWHDGTGDLYHGRPVADGPENR